MRDIVKLGDRARDNIIGCEGIVVAMNEWLHSCKRFGIQPQLCDEKTGKPAEIHWFDEARVELCQESAIPKPGPGIPPGGPRENPGRP